MLLPAEEERNNYMKKTIALLILSISLMLAVVGCKKDDSKDGSETEATPTPAGSVEEEDDSETSMPLENPVVKEDYDFNDYIKLGKYKGIEVKLEKLEVKDEDISVAIQADLFDSGITPIEVTDRPIKSGDTVNIDFVGYHNGEPFDGGSAEGYNLIIGSGAFIKGFEEQLIGAELNKELEINVVFPEDYPHTKLAGEPVVFKITVNNIRYFELTEEFIKELGFEGEEDYREYLFQELSKNNEEKMKRQKENYLYNTVIKEAEITLPKNLIDYYAYDLRVLYSNIAASYGMDLETFITLSGYSIDDFEADVESYSNTMATRELVIKAISTIEEIELTEEEFQDKVAELAEQYGYESKEEFLEGADVEVLKDDLLFNKVIEFLVAESVEI